MRLGDAVGVVSERSPWHGQVGTIVDFTREGDVMVHLGDATRALHPQEVRWRPSGAWTPPAWAPRAARRLRQSPE
jgi:hypothetical protein